MMKSFKYVYLAVVMAMVISYQIYSMNSLTGGVSRDIAEPMAENILLAMNENDYPRFSKDFDEKMKNGLNETEYKRKVLPIKQLIGEYEAKSFMAIGDEGQYTMVTYTAKFSQEPDDVIVRIIVREDKGRAFVAGFWLDSPKLRDNVG